MCFLSLCMIVKNEEADLSRCLDSVKGLVDEIIIVDTGSLDLTKEICSLYGAKRYDYQWEDNFAMARNYSVSLATGEWILWMDADEVLVHGAKEDLIKVLKDSESSVFAVKMLHLCETENIQDKNYYISYNHRLFRSRKELTFEGAIHEKLMIDKEVIVEESNMLEIIHYGYLRQYKDRKSNRNLDIVLKELNAGKEDPWLFYYLASELYYYGDCEKALQSINLSILRFLSKGIMAPALLYRLKYEILQQSEQLESTESGLRMVIEQYPDYVDLHYLRGVTLYQMNQYDDSIKEFYYCLMLGENNVNYLIKAGSGTFSALYYTGKCYLKLGKIEYAREAFKQSLLYYPNYSLAMEMLNEIG